VRGQTIKYNSKQKLGRGFSLEELKVGSMKQGMLADQLYTAHRQQQCSGCY
jgi:ribosomal protein L13E